MSSTIITKNSSTASAVPSAGSLVQGELAVNVTDKKLYTKDSSAAVVKVVGSLGNQEANAVAITGGTIAGITDLAIADGGTGASTAANARTNLGAAASGSNSDITSLSGLTTALSVAQGGTGVTTATGSGSVVLSNSPTLVTPALGTPSSGVATNLTGLPLTTGVTGTLPVANGGTGITSLGSGVATFLGTPSSANLAAAVSDETGTGALVFANSPTLVTPALGTPASATLTNATGLPLTTGVTGTLPVANGGTGTTTSTGTGSVVLSSSPTLVTPALGTPSSATLTNATGLPVATGISGLGTGVATALAVNVGSAGAPVVNGGALGTPSSGTVTNLTGTASININGTVGATTANTGAFTTLSATGVATLSAGTAAAPAITTSGDTNTGIFFPAADTIAFSEGGAEAMRITSAGDVGIGTSSPASRLQVVGGVITNTIDSLGNISHGRDVSQGTIARYLLLVKNIADGGSVIGRITGKRANSSGGGRNGGYIDVAVTGRSGGAPAVSWSSHNFVSGVGLVTLDYDDGTGTANWVAVDASLTGASAVFNFAYFDGATDLASFVWVVAASVSNVLPRDSDMIQNFGGRLRITSAGNVGIGTSLPTELLQINATQPSDAGFKISSSSDGWVFKTAYAANNDIDLTISSENSGVSPAERMRITSEGNLGIGTSSPAQQLHLTGIQLFENAGEIRFKDFGGTQRTAVTLDSSNNLNIGTSANGSLRFINGSTYTERARITSGGDLLVGTTSALGKVTAQQAGASSDVFYAAVGTGGSAFTVQGSGSTMTAGYFATSTGAAGSITCSGTATLYNITSDQRLKENIQDADSASSLIDSLQVRQYDWKSDGSHQRYGFVAQELVTVAPEAVYQPADPEEMMAVDYSKLVPMLVKEIQSLRARVAQLETN